MIFRSAGCDGRTLIIVIREAVLLNTLRRQCAASKQQQLQRTSDASESVRTHARIEILLPSPPRHQFIRGDTKRISKHGLRIITKC